MREAITEDIREAIRGTQRTLDTPRELSHLDEGGNQRTLDTPRELSHLDAAQTPSDASVSSSYLMRAAI